MSDLASAALAVEQTIRIEAPRERVFALLTDVEEMPRWMPVVTFEPHVGGRFEMVKDEWEAEGEVIEFDPPRAVAFTWDWRNQPLGARTEVRFELEDHGGATVVHLRHAGFTEQAQQKSHTEGWAHYTGRLKTIAEGADPGPDMFASRGGV